MCRLVWSLWSWTIWQSWRNTRMELKNGGRDRRTRKSLKSFLRSVVSLIHPVNSPTMGLAVKVDRLSSLSLDLYRLNLWCLKQFKVKKSPTSWFCSVFRSFCFTIWWNIWYIGTKTTRWSLHFQTEWNTVSSCTSSKSHHPGHWEKIPHWFWHWLLVSNGSKRLSRSQW